MLRHVTKIIQPHHSIWTHVFVPITRVSQDCHMILNELKCLTEKFGFVHQFNVRHRYISVHHLSFSYKSYL